MTIEELIIIILPSMVVGISMALLNRRLKKTDEAREKYAKATALHNAKLLSFISSIGKYVHAVAMALKRANLQDVQINGELETAMEEYVNARSDLFGNMNERVYENMQL